MNSDLRRSFNTRFNNQKTNFFSTSSYFIFNLFTNLHHGLNYPTTFIFFTNAAANPHGSLQYDGFYTYRLAAEILTNLHAIKKGLLLQVAVSGKKELVSNKFDNFFSATHTYTLLRNFIIFVVERKFSILVWRAI